MRCNGQFKLPLRLHVQASRQFALPPSLAVRWQPMTSLIAKISLHATAVLYTGGTVAQLLKLFLDFPWREMPFIIDWLIIVLGGIGAAGLIWLHRKIAYRGLWERVTHWLIIVHLVSSVILHIWTIAKGDHEFYESFPYAYSYFALLYFGFFAWRSWTVRLENHGPENAI